MKPSNLTFRPDGTFRVLMMSDLQESASYDPRSLRSVEALLDECAPDLVILGAGYQPPRIRAGSPHRP